jgi:hypothetical protein
VLQLHVDQSHVHCLAVQEIKGAIFGHIWQTMEGVGNKRRRTEQGVGAPGLPQAVIVDLPLYSCVATWGLPVT